MSSNVWDGKLSGCCVFSITGVCIRGHPALCDPQGVLTPEVEIILRAWTTPGTMTAVSRLGLGVVFSCVAYKQSSFFLWGLGDEDKEPARERNILSQYLMGWVQFDARAKIIFKKPSSFKKHSIVGLKGLKYP